MLLFFPPFLSFFYLLSSAINSSSGQNRGELHLKLHLFTSSSQRTSAPSALLRHRRLLRTLLAHELVSRDPPPYTWRDDFSAEAAQVLAQHAVQARMDRDQTAMARSVRPDKLKKIFGYTYKLLFL